MTNPKPQSGCCEKCGCDGLECAGGKDWEVRFPKCREVKFCHDHNCKCHSPASSEWEEWRRTRTEVIGEMIENPDHIGIFPTTKCFNALDEAVNKLLTSTEERVRESMLKNVGMLRQWLNEDRITDLKKMVSSEDIIHWLTFELKNHK